MGKGCSCSREETNNNPVIESLTAEPALVYLSGSSQIVCKATDVDGDQLNYNWECISGTINGSGDSIIWVAPDSEGIFTLSVIVSDNKRGEDKKEVTIEVKTPKLIYLKGGDPINWTVQGGIYSQYEEIQHWEAAGYEVTTQDLNSTTIDVTLLNNFDALRLHQGFEDGTVSEASAIYDWVIGGGNFIADINASTSSVNAFGVEMIKGNYGGSTGLDWVYHGAPWTFGPVTGPFSYVNTMAAQAMDQPVLSEGHILNLDASVNDYPIIVHGEFGEGKVIIIFAQGWSHDATRPQNAYRSTIFQADNIEFLENCIKYFNN